MESPDRAEERVRSWRELGSNAGKDEASLKAFYGELASWLVMLPVEKRMRVVFALEKENFSGSPIDILIRSAMKSILTPASPEEAQSIKPNTHRGAAIAARKMFEYGENWTRALNEVVSFRNGKYELNLEKRVASLDRSGKLRILTGKEWIDEQLRDIGAENLANWGKYVDGDTGSRVLAMLGNSPAVTQSTNHTQPGHGGNVSLAPSVPAPVTSGHVHESRNRMAAPSTPQTGLTGRQIALEDPSLQPVLDKCIACHVMKDSTRHLTTLPQLKAAMREGEYGTFQRKIMGMMGRDADAVHIHFTPEEISAVGKLYRSKTVDADDAAEVPKALPELVSIQERRFSTQTARGKALQNPVVTQALYRCLACHRDPSNQGSTGEVNTISKLRAAMHTIDERTLNLMVDRGYVDGGRMIHITDLKSGEKLYSALVEIAKMPADKPEGAK